jgi:hypothetical protein
MGRNSPDNSKREIQTVIPEFESWVVSQPVRVREIYASMSRRSPPFAGFLRLTKNLWVPNMIFFVMLCHKSLRNFGKVAVFWKNNPENRFDYTVWPVHQCIASATNLHNSEKANAYRIRGQNLESGVANFARTEFDLPPLKWSSLMYVFDRGGYGNGKEAAYG